VNTSDHKFGEKSVKEQISGVGEPVWVQCKVSGCLAVMDKNGNWKKFYDGVQLSGVIKALSNQSNK